MKYFDRLKNLRIDNDLTETYVADLLKIEQQQYHDYENGHKSLPLDYLRTLCKLYGVSSNYILGLPSSLEYPKR